MRRMVFLAVLVMGCATGGAAEKQKSCRAHAECPSRVCSHYKKDSGFCAPVKCSPGERADNNHFYCDAAGKWKKSRRTGEPCSKAWECFQPTCYMDPMCDARPKQTAVCKAGKCALETAPDACAQQGGRRVLAPEEYVQDASGRCMESMAQRVLRTVCVPCGNGTCDEGESVCNCPADCKAQATPAQSPAQHAP